MNDYLDVYSRSINKAGEELCGDKITVVRDTQHTRAVLSDGLGSGVKANSLATLTATIIATMLKEDASLSDVIATIAGTLPVCRTRGIAYATFTVIDVDHATNGFRVINFGNPAVLFVSGGRYVNLQQRTETYCDREISYCEGELQRGDFLGAVSDGVCHAGPDGVFNYSWGTDQIGAYLQEMVDREYDTAAEIVDSVMDHTTELYQGKPGDDASMIGLYLREENAVMVFTGPPADEDDDEPGVMSLQAFAGRKIVCGGTTGNIVARITGEEIVTDLTSMREDIPPIAELKGVNLVTEGILTVNKARELIEVSGGDISRLPDDRNGAVMLAAELLHADRIYFLVGLSINPYYQNPLLPESMSIRRQSVERLAACLMTLHKDVTVDYC